MAAWAVFDLTRGYRRAKDKQNYLLRSLGGLVVVTVVLFLFGPFFIISPVKIGYSSLGNSEVRVYYPSAHRARGLEILAMAQQAVQKNKGFYGQVNETKVLVALSDLDMLRFGVYPKGNGGGFIWGIVIRESKASWNFIAHEMSHKNLSKISPFSSSIFSFPRWFDEGLASYIGKMDWYRKLPELKGELQTGCYRLDITNWNSLLGEFQWINQTFFQHNSHLIYGQTYLMVKYLFDTYGENRVHQLVQKIHLGTSFDQAFLQTTGLSVEEFHQQFINFIKNS